MSAWVDAHYEFDLHRRFFEETVSRNLRLGRILVLVVGDYIRSSVVDMLGYINKYPHLAVNVALVELKCFQLDEKEDWPLLVVPTVVAKTEIVERSIVQVNVAADGAVTVTAEQEKMDAAPSASRARLSEDEFWERLKAQDPHSLGKARQLIRHYAEKEGVSIRPRDNSIAVHLHLPESGQRISLFFIRTDGTFESWHGTIAKQMAKGGLDEQLMGAYVHDLEVILKQHKKKWSINSPLIEVDVDELILAVDRFILKLIQAEPKPDS